MTKIQVESQGERGEVIEIGGLKSYASGPNDSDTAVILASDVHGYGVPHLRNIADKISAAGFYTLVPDFFNGDPFVSDQPNKPFQDWLKKHPAEKAIKDANKFVKALRKKGIKKIGAAGFCWGGKVAVDLSKPPSVRAVVLLHPTYINVTDIQGVNAPIAILGGQNDTLVPPSLIKQYESALNARHKVESFVKIFPGVKHGWTLKYNDTDKAAVKMAEEAHKDLLSWFVKYIK
ncbi:alpha/beta-Hydrolases superfamily protein [Striga hermonthica]|uniref:Alpha/beta-Hydrolases superfamily protein n=1 Tax=Striga hermonthica TaxID=68872 RepID=A0A9N7RP36_STRHE|nr:alpha/beta-Hydrolases superfamily protein [Striga hermonthica]